MGRPQQPELRRSDRGETNPQGRKVTREAERPGRERGPGGPLPEENQPGHHPDKEQDKPG